MVAALVRRLAGYSAAGWRVAGRIEIASEAVVALAELGRAAGVPAPRGAAVIPLRPHGLADQAEVLAGELLAALEAAPDPVLAARVDRDLGALLARLDATGPRLGR